MKAVVLYDSNFGNTKLIAETIASEFGDNTKVLQVSNFNIADLQEFDVLIIGSPIIGWRPSENMGKFLSGLQKDQLSGIKAAAFDTRVKIFFSGDAAKKISKQLENAGADILTASIGFYVKGKEGPLLDGEVERAREWAQSIEQKLK